MFRESKPQKLSVDRFHKRTFCACFRQSRLSAWQHWYNAHFTFCSSCRLVSSSRCWIFCLFWAYTSFSVSFLVENLEKPFPRSTQDGKRSAHWRGLSTRIESECEKWRRHTRRGNYASVCFRGARTTKKALGAWKSETTKYLKFTNQVSDLFKPLVINVNKTALAKRIVSRAISFAF